MTKWLALGVIALTSIAFFPQDKALAQDKFVEGKDYMLIKSPVRTSDPKKIEVTEVFWYGCPHCRDFRPGFEQWKKQQPEDVVVLHSPGMWNDRMKTHAKIFYTAKTLGLLDKMHVEIFDAYHNKKQKLVKTGEIYGLFEKHGIDKDKFEKTFKSFGINSMVQQANSRARGYGITGTPEVIVNGKYRISASMTGSQAKMMKVAEYLIEKERAAMASSS
jgi:thiol:disulfide interchange protein DsbA